MTLYSRTVKSKSKVLRKLAFQLMPEGDPLARRSVVEKKKQKMPKHVHYFELIGGSFTSIALKTCYSFSSFCIFKFNFIFLNSCIRQSESKKCFSGLLKNLIPFFCLIEKNVKETSIHNFSKDIKFRLYTNQNIIFNSSSVSIRHP